jgi:DNA-binding PadR family transcriptional regulator
MPTSSGNGSTAGSASSEQASRTSQPGLDSTLVLKFEHSCCTTYVNPTRLFVLGALAKHGPMYGHQLRRDARLDRTRLWSEVRPGSLYSALHRMAAEGLIEPVRTEQQGQLPARTVYAITAEGQRELRVLRAEALREVRLQPDPVDLALAMSTDMDEDMLRDYLEDRMRVLSAQASVFEHQRDRCWPDQTVADDLVLEHARRRIRAEIDWHQLVLDQLGKLAADSAPRRATA